MSLDAATVGAVFTGTAGIIIAIGGVIKIVTTRPRLPVAEEVLEQLDELRGDVLALARWAHRAIAQAAAQGVELEPPPDVLKSAGEREGERGSDPTRHGWRSSVRVQTAEQPATRARPVLATGPDTQPERRAQRPTPPR